MSIVGLGALAGAVWVASLRNDGDFRRYLAFGNLGFPVFMIIFAFSRDYVTSNILLFAMGFCFVTQNSLANTILQKETSSALRGRVMSLYSLVFIRELQDRGAAGGRHRGRPLLPLFALGAGAALSLIYNGFIAFRYLLRRQDHK